MTQGIRVRLGALTLLLMLSASTKSECLVVFGDARSVEPDSGSASKPTEATAIVDVQRFLNLRTGRWTVHRVTKKSERSGQVKNRETYEMDAVLDVTVHSAGELRRRDLENDPWLARISGRAGERKSTPVTLTWVRTDSGWKLRSLR
ncbi:MAG TPA: hypothetical protein VGK86_14595 [Thermoanaerobaculia bacterium]